MTIDDVAALLRDMEDAAGVAFLLSMFGIKGNRSWCASCPVARLTQMLTGNPNARVNVWALSNGRGQYRALPTSANSFVVQFDRGAWPELEEATS